VGGNKLGDLRGEVQGEILARKAEGGTTRDNSEDFDLGELIDNRVTSSNERRDAEHRQTNVLGGITLST
jgi:hypothetical protein